MYFWFLLHFPHVTKKQSISQEHTKKGTRQLLFNFGNIFLSISGVNKTDTTKITN